MKYHPGTYGANMSHPTKGYINVNRYGEWGHYKQGRFDRGHGLATAHGDSSQHFKDLDKHLGTLKEAIEIEKEKSSEQHKITTDMLSGREKGGKLNSFKNFKVDLVTSGEETIPADIDKGEDTREKQKITTNPGPVDVKLDDKLTGPTPYTHFSSEHQITHEQVQVDEKVIAGTPGWEKMKKNVKDKSGATHTPMSRARDLARKSFSKLKKETMMGKISN
jgi:hypothetical protein